MSARTKLVNRQKNWAISAGLSPDERGYLSKVEDNLQRPLSTKARQAFDNGSGSELVDTPTRPAKMKALHSSSALAVNVFDNFAGGDSAPLAEALSLDSNITDLIFEEQYPTGLGGNPPNLDVVMTLDSGHVLAIESKFTEWLSAKPASKEFFKSRYFPEDNRLWELQGLPRTQKLAESIHDGDEYFRYLDIAQLLKHALGLATKCGSNFSLYYLYFDSDGQESEVHSAEIARFEGFVGKELGFRAMSYQSLFGRVESSGKADQEYIQYLRDRYFSDE